MPASSPVEVCPEVEHAENLLRAHHSKLHTLADFMTVIAIAWDKNPAHEEGDTSAAWEAKFTGQQNSDGSAKITCALQVWIHGKSCHGQMGLSKAGVSKAGFTSRAYKGVVVQGVLCKGVVDKGAAAAGIAAEQDLSCARDAELRIYQQRPRQLGHLRLCHQPGIAT